YERDLKAYEQQQAEIKEAEDFIQRNIARASTSKRAQSRRTQLEAMPRLDKPLGDLSSASFSFQVKRKSGNDVLTVRDLAFSYKNSDASLFEHIAFDATRGERIALVGPNGVGKTTLLKIILGRLKQTGGTIQLGTNVNIGYYDQEQADLSSNKNVLQELWDDFPHVNEADIRTVLGNFLFSGNDVLKSVTSLSGGEKARLALAKLMMQRANLLILDEPTNHLDIDSKEVLEAALKNFPGTILFVSHDRFFINELATKVLEMAENNVTTYLGNYDYFVEKKQEMSEREKLKNEPIDDTKRDEADRKLQFEKDQRLQREERRRKRQIKQIEEDIFKHEQVLETIEEKMTHKDVYENHEKSLELLNEANETKVIIDELMEQWSELHNT